MDNERLYSDLVKLGDMMGDGLHHEPGGEWISREYKMITDLLFPEAKANREKHKRAGVDDMMAKLLSEKRYTKCNGELKQTRKGAKTCRCVSCNSKFIAKSA